MENTSVLKQYTLNRMTLWNKMEVIAMFDILSMLVCISLN